LSFPLDAVATVNPGSGATLKSNTAEQQVVESVMLLWQAERVSVQNPTAVNSVVWTVNSSGGMFQGSFSLPATQSIQAGGALLITVVPYLSGVSFAVGANSTYSSASVEAAVLERLMYLQGLEQQSARNPNSRNFVTGTFDSETKLYQGTFSLPVATEIGSQGEIKFTAIPYLID
jgi:hypothetical protein